ncbi:MAG: hypothetical protein MJY76_01475 [Bacteroidales bacterium]|nr:hypothetical protein [Bacteroidales bacterium]
MFRYNRTTTIVAILVLLISMLHLAVFADSADEKQLDEISIGLGLLGLLYEIWILVKDKRRKSDKH